jgi:hypothetical protein
VRRVVPITPYQRQVVSLVGSGCIDISVETKINMSSYDGMQSDLSNADISTLHSNDTITSTIGGTKDDDSFTLSKKMNGVVLTSIDGAVTDTTAKKDTIVELHHPSISSNATTTTTIADSSREEATSFIGSITPDPSSLPISIVRYFRINHPYNIDTNITVQLFQERSLVTCSQGNANGRISTWLLCQPTMNLYSLKTKNQIEWDVNNILGGNHHQQRDSPLYTVYCQRISTLLWERIHGNSHDTAVTSTITTSTPAIRDQQPKPILFGLSLWNGTERDGSHEPELFHTIVNLVVNTIVEAMALSS